MFKKSFYFILGFTSFGLGVIGVFLPVLPTTPFMLLSAWAFTRTSDRFLNWLESTKVYQEYGAGFQDGKGIHRKKKYRIIIITWSVMLISIYFVPLWPVRLFMVTCGLVFGYYLFFILPDRPE